MSKFTNKIDFAVLITVKNANPNGDPLNGNRPREDYEGFGEISDVCIKRKIRNRLQDMGEEIFVQSEGRYTDGYRSLSERAKNCPELSAALKVKPMRKQPAKNGLMCEASDRYSHLKKKTEAYRSVSEGRFPYTLP